MNEARKSEMVADLRAQIQAKELGTRPAGSLPSLPFGVPEIDAAPPSGGLMLGAMHEVHGGSADLIRGAAAASFIGGILARTIGPIIGAFPHRDLFAPGLAAVGVHPDRIIYVDAGRDLLLAVEEALQHVGLAAVVGEIESPIGLTASRRL